MKDELELIEKTREWMKAQGIYQSNNILPDTIGPLRSLEEISRLTGNFVQLKPEFGFMPALIDSNNQPVFLYHLIEGIEEHLNFDAVVKEFPTLSFSQIAAAISFIRKVAQLNSRRIDIDALEEEFDAQDSEFLDELRKAYNERVELTERQTRISASRRTGDA